MKSRVFGLVFLLGAIGFGTPTATAAAPLWYLTSAREFRLSAPPPARSVATRRDLRELLRLQSRRPAAARRLAEHWNSGPPALLWTQEALNMIVVHSPRPPAAARSLALLETALYDAMIAAEDSSRAYRNVRPAPSRLSHALHPLPHGALPASAPVQAAMAGAAETVLPFVFPDEPARTFTRLADQATASLLVAGVDYPSDVRAARELGRRVGTLAVARGMSDGFTNTGFSEGPFTGEMYWQPTPPTYESPNGGPVGTWRPWIMSSPGELLHAIPPPANYGSPAFLAQVQKVLDTRRHEGALQRELVFYWDDAPGTYTPPGHWVSIGAQAAGEARLSSDRATTLLSTLAAAEADAGIAAFQAKYHYWAPRPITAIWRLCDGGSRLCTEAELQADPQRATYRGSWYPLIMTPAFPSYPAAHPTFSGAAATVLGAFFPKLSKVWTGLSEQAAMSRLYGGIHFDEDNQQGLRLGRAVGMLALQRLHR